MPTRHAPATIPTVVAAISALPARGSIGVWAC